MVMNKYSLGLIFVVLTMGSLFLNSSLVNVSDSSLSYASKFGDWRPDNQTIADLCSCHTVKENLPGSGTIDVSVNSSVAASSDFNLQAKVTGFTQAQSDNIVIGLNPLDNNNTLFTDGVVVRQTPAVNASGNSNYATLGLTAPQTEGDYSLLLYALHASTTVPFTYLSKVVNITVTPAVNTTPTTNTTAPTADIVTYKVDQAILVDDGEVDSVWDSIPQTSISEFGTGGYIKSVQDGTYLYTLMAYESSMKWIGVEFNISAKNPDYMATGTDGWIFGTGTSQNYYGDYNFVGTGDSPQRNTKDLVFFDTIVKDSMTYIETARLLESNDTTSNDFEFYTGETFTAVFASSTYHTNDHTVLTWAITDNSPTGVNSNPNPTPKIGTSINLQQVSDAVFVFSVVIVLVTVFIHISLRVVSKPITHEKRIVYSNKIPNHPGSIVLIKTFLKGQKNKIFKPKPKMEKKE